MKKIWVVIVVLFILQIGNMAKEVFGYPANNEQERAIEEVLNKILPDKIYDAVWNDFFYYFTNFDSMEASTGDNTFEEAGVIAVTLSGWSVDVEADVTAASFMQKVQIPSLGGSDVGLNRNLGWGTPQRFRANFSFYDSTAPGAPEFTGYIVRGATPQSSYGQPHFGFKIIDDTLYGTVDSVAAAEQTVQLQSVSNGTAYVVEARYLPSDKVIFLVQDNTTLKMEEKGVITTGLINPNSTLTSAFYGIENTRTNNHTVQFLGSFFEYIQKQRRF